MNIYLNRNKKFQIFQGFGASGAWWAQEVGGWEHADINGDMSVRDRLSQLLFSKEEGIGLRTYRYNLGGGSGESGRCNIDNPLRTTESFEVSCGEYDFNRDRNAVYMMKRAVADGAEEVVFFVNSPIERLTKNNKAHCDSSKPFMDNLDKKNYASFAKYCLDVTEHFINEGIPVKYLSPINEPVWIWTGSQEGCHYSPRSAGRVLKVFADEMNERPGLEELKLAGLESGDIRWFNKSYTKNLFKYKSVRDRVDAVDIHSYFLKPVPIAFFSRVAFLRRYRKWLDRHYPGVDVKVSEWCHMQGGRDKGMNSALVMANVIYEDISILNVTSWQHWIALSEVDYCDGLIYINLNDKTYETTKRYYATGNFSKYIPYGARRIESYCDSAILKTLAFEKDGVTVLILINDTETAQTVYFPSEDICKCTLVVTNENYNLKQFRVECKDGIEISAKSVNTVVFGS